MLVAHMSVTAQAITIGIATLLECSRRIYVMAPGASKKPVMDLVLHAPASARTPASFLRYGGHVTFLLDQPACPRLV